MRRTYAPAFIERGPSLTSIAAINAVISHRPSQGLNEDVQTLRGARVLDGRFATVQQAVGTAKTNVAGAAFLRSFVEEAKASGLVSSLIARHKVEGRLSTAPLN